MNVASILKDKGRSVTTAPATATLEDIARRLSAKRIGAIPIIGDKGELAGIVSERDVVKAVGLRGAACLSEPVSSTMTRTVMTCRLSDSLDAVMAQMTRGRFRHVPVVEDGALIGIISIGDVVKHHIAEVEMEASAMKSYFVAG